LPIRLAKISETTQLVLAFLNNHQQVEYTYFPLQEGSPQLQLAQQQMKGACGLITFVLKANSVEQIEAFCNALQHILMAVSWGGYESLIIPKCAGMPKASFDASNQEHRMLRLYVGLEEPSYIINDLLLGFAAMQAQ
jgi:cystathionine beta-lyase/cystathionine gamma-synthase